MKSILTPRQKLFVERSCYSHEYPTRTDAYLSVYGDNGNRRHATINASRIYARPAVQAYANLIRAESEKMRVAEARKTAIEAQRRHDAFIDALVARNLRRK